MVDTNRTHLTKKQFEILRMRKAGKSLAEIAKVLRTSRSNISSIAKTAEDNVSRSKNTLKLIETINWPVKIEVKADSNIYDVSERLFEEADEARIKIPHNYSEIVRLITETLGMKNIRKRKALKDFKILISKDGKVEIL